MADDSKQSGSGPGMGGNAFIWVALAAIGAAFLNPGTPLQNLRPRQEDTQIQQMHAEQDIDARLWQDPFAAVTKEAGDRYDLKRGADGPAVPPPNRPTTQRQCEDARSDVDLHLCPPLRKADSAKTDIIAVMVPGGPYSEDAESRRRTRYAVLAALNVQDYVPVDSEHVGFFLPSFLPSQGDLPARPAEGVAQADWEAPQAEARPAANWRLPRFVPYEFLKKKAPQGNDPEDAKKRQILLLWLNDDVFSSDPLDNLARLACLVRPGGRYDAKFKIVGPQDSDTLLAMVENLRPQQKEDGPAGQDREKASENWAPCGMPRDQAIASLEIFNYAATVEPARLCDHLRPGVLPDGNCNHPDEAIHDSFRKNSIAFWQTTASDDVLAKALSDELRNWGIGRCSPGPACASGAGTAPEIALVSEWDTFYGQTMPDTLARYLGAAGPTGDAGQSTRQDPVHQGTPIKRYSYLRGLDGQLPDPPKDRSARSPADGQAGSSTAQPGTPASDAASLSQLADGQGQSDYLRRLAGRLREEDQRSRLAGKGGIRAIGILGTDVYDKLLVLRALKDEIRDAVFFTTDLDARLLHPNRAVPTRGLIVASSFGLRLADPLQQDIPPFRGVYQTAAFLSTLLAAQPPAQDGNTSLNFAHKIAGSVQIFEIGRSDALHLRGEEPPTIADSPSPACSSQLPVDVLACNQLQPAIGTGASSPQWISWRIAGTTLVTAIGLYAFLVLLLGLYRGKDWLQERATIVKVPVSFLMVLVAAYLFCCEAPGLAQTLSEGGQGDLPSWLEGISLWPTTSIRLVSLVLSVGLIIHVRRALENNLKAISREFGMDATRERITKCQKARKKDTTYRIAFKDANPFYIRKLEDIGGTESPDEAMGADAAFDDSCATKFWERYIDRGHGPSQRCRVAVCVMITTLVLLGLSLVLGKVEIPHRGKMSFDAFAFVTVLDFISNTWLMFFVADATLFSWLFVKEVFGNRLAKHIWPSEVEDAFAKRMGMQPAQIGDTLALYFVALRTACITRMIYYPFIMITVMVASRSSLLGAFSADPTVFVSQLLSLMIVFISAIALRTAAEQARKMVSGSLLQQLLVSKGKADQSALSAQWQLLLDRVAAYRDGAFSPLAQQPMIRGLLLPLGTYGGTTALQYLNLVNF